MKTGEAIEVCEDRIKWAGNYYGEKWRVEKPFLERCLKALKVYEILTSGEKTGELFIIRNRNTRKEVAIDLGVCTIGSGIFTADGNREIFAGDAVEWRIGGNMEQTETGIVSYSNGAFWFGNCLLCDRSDLSILSREEYEKNEQITQG